jgi:hypothetical protein
MSSVFGVSQVQKQHMPMAGCGSSTSLAYNFQPYVNTHTSALLHITEAKSFPFTPTKTNTKFSVSRWLHNLHIDNIHSLVTSTNNHFKNILKFS